ncbi:MAG: tRNA (adenosine(37)-N6)-threonylcarbamoyltransferase complex transferase subunit TsaD [Patescibacteria group bacterium]|nr:tRNA (adenosine(37)-N6)-threonylcarbamoyltransferase complex transferase subunit TsaD [Patescibacteria group bacterium]
MKILGIETSCDETALAVVETDGRDFKVIKNLVYSQIPIHEKYGGVVPEVAARAHVEKMPELLMSLGSRDGKGIDAIAVTHGPGLVTSLRVGVETAKTLAWLWKKPLVGINHIEGHIMANWLAPIRKIQNPNNKFQNIRFPAIALVVSGGHTELFLMPRLGEYKKIGQTLDDAAGEAFDKVAKILDIGYPGGPAVARWAESGRTDAFDFPRPMLDRPDFNFSFSGLKTAVLYQVMKNKSKTKNQKYMADVCASFQEAVVDTLVGKTIKAAQASGVKIIMLGGGVSANAWLRRELEMGVTKFLPNVGLVLPEIKYTGDNAAMIAAAGYLHAIKKDFIDWRKIEVDPNLSL